MGLEEPHGWKTAWLKIKSLDKDINKDININRAN